MITEKEVYEAALETLNKELQKDLISCARIDSLGNLIDKLSYIIKQ